MNDHIEQLVNYIRQHLDSGIPEAAIRQSLAQANWSEEHVNQAFQYINAQTAQANQQQQPVYPTADAQQQAQNQPQQYAQSAPAKYRIFRAVGDTYKAIRNNAVTFVLSVTASYVVASITLALVTLFTMKVLYGDFGLRFATTPKLITVIIGSLIVYTLWYAFVYTFVMNTLSTTLYDGADNRKNSVKATLSKSLRSVGRVAAANTLFALVCLWPFTLMVVVPLAILTAGSAASNSLFLILPILMIAAMAWGYIAFVRYALAPYVALFEPDVPIIKTLGRSKHLLTKGGQWFLLKGMLLLFTILIVLAIATGSDVRSVLNTGNIVLNIFLTIVSITAQGAMVMLYRNRRVVRDTVQIEMKQQS
ncbi:MAG: hypothetical protein JWL85_508 [Candidatus Saccharibacteria bacterium]|nr:hypothetical protein [Candidatus Saccharibacteria bacterium]